jgi:hypothetical protein
VATAVDELDGQPAGVTGAILGAGEELRPTGTNRALLGRLGEMTGGKLRDTLAGIFHDRSSRRFAYDPLSAPLVAAAAALLLLGVAARRLSLPDAVARWPARLRARLRRERRRRERPDATRTVDALIDAKQRSEARAAEQRPPHSVPRVAARATPVAKAPVAPVAAAPPSARRPAAAGAAPPPAEPGPATAPPGLSTAEILLARRRGRGR